MNTVLIADDEPRLAEDLARRLRRCWRDVSIVAVVENGVRAAEELARLRPQFAFLDIRMPGLSGLEVAAGASDTRVVFVTAFEEYAIAAFEASAVDYLLKPVSDGRLSQCVLKLERTAAPQLDIAALVKQLEKPKAAHLAWLHAGIGNTTRVLAVSEVLYFRSGDKYTDVVTPAGRYVIRASLKELVQRLDPQQFAQVHRSTIVNLRAIERLERDVLQGHQLHLRNHADVIPVGRAFAAQFRKM
ncbi:MAG TPA: LytTR family DNA-binding domain-containing protein [Povalibacter sp.]|nr:LytTR family DNA-binding domain-containing protein [Povalibacter sp.]